MKENWKAINLALAISLVIILASPTFMTNSSSSFSSRSSIESAATTPSSQPVFAWLFGYVGGTFYPQKQLGLTQSDLVNVAQNLSSVVGASNLELVTAVSEVPGKNVNSTMVPVVKSFVDSLIPYASVVYGRLDLFMYNVTSKLSIYNQSSMYINELDLNGIWLDHASEYYAAVGQVTFNQMMQNLTDEFPNVHFILNHTFHRVLIAPSNGTTWESMTYVSPSTKSDLYVNTTLLASLNHLFPGHVLMHFDAFAPKSYEPMGRFADLTNSQENTTLANLAYKGANAKYSRYEYNVLYPIIGGWTYSGSEYQGNLYNSLSIGNYARSTINNFTNIMLSNMQLHIGITNPVFAWLYGYVGDQFYPETNLSLSVQAVTAVAENLSAAVGASNLRLVAPVDVVQGHNIQPKYIPTIKEYVDSLKPYASVIYGRLDFNEFNGTTTPSLYAEVSMFVNQLDLNGIWFDHGQYLYAKNSTSFNQLMQNLTDSFPSLQYIVNEAANTANASNYITPSSGTTWGRNTYISPTVAANSYDKVPFTRIAELNKIYPGHVLLHLDAFAPSKTSPMGIFANRTSTNEVYAVRYMAHTGAFPSSKNYSYVFLFPVIGSFTSDYSIYKGSLYNSLNSGSYPRSTIANFTSTMIKTYHVA